MNRRSLTLVLLFFALVAHPRAASAWGFWSWLEEWSGPGPFRGGTVLFTSCIQSSLDGSNTSNTRTKLKPSPIAMTDDFHRGLVEQWKSLYKDAPPLSSDVLKRILANPEPITSFKIGNFLNPPPSQTPPPPQQDPSSLQRTQDATITAQRAATPPVTNPLFSQSNLRTFYDSPVADSGPGHSDKRMVCFYVDQGFFSAAADAERKFPEVGVYMGDIGPTARLHDGLDIGGGFGWARITSQPAGLEPVRQFRLTLTPIRVLLRPILLALPEEWREGRQWLGVFTIYWKETFIYGGLTGADLGVPDNKFVARDELIRSFGINIDFGSVLAQWIH